ncbi:MAG: hypothetical protein HC899_13980 [Leptolyngbyaceae cyanobacterium SM1_4_3]|nr:hypothetical protein [Leptolyngbyaceae cyanobacterium SM1_4_3]
MPLQTESGSTQGLVKIMQDKTQSRQAAEREQFLARSSAALAASIDYKTTLTTIARLAVPFLADYCFLDAINASGQIERVAWYAANPVMQAGLTRCSSLFLPKILTAIRLLMSCEAETLILSQKSPQSG